MGSSTLRVGGVAVEVTRKPVKHTHLAVHPPSGGAEDAVSGVTLSAAPGLPEEALRLFVVSRLGWIRRERRRLAEQPRESSRAFLERESHHVWGRRYLLELAYADARPRVELGPRALRVTLRTGLAADAGARSVAAEAVVAAWHRALVRAAAAPRIAAAEARMGVVVERLFVQRMKTRWGSATPTGPGRGRIRLNSELAKLPPRCLDYLVVHEAAHLRERSHGPAFVALLDRFRPGWRGDRAALGRLPVPEAGEARRGSHPRGEAE